VYRRDTRGLPSVDPPQAIAGRTGVTSRPRIKPGVAVLSQEEGELRIEVDHSWIWSKGRKVIPLSEFKHALKQAEASLLKMKKRP
jgi:hypothetical protein